MGQLSPTQSKQDGVALGIYSSWEQDFSIGMGYHTGWDSIAPEDMVKYSWTCSCLKSKRQL